MFLETGRRREEVRNDSTAEVVMPDELRSDSSGEEEAFEVGSGVHEYSCKWEAGDWPPTGLYAANQTLSAEVDIAT